MSRIAILSGDSSEADVLSSYLANNHEIAVTIREHPPSKLGLLKRRFRRLGFWPTADQLAFMTCAQPLLGLMGRRRREELFLQAAPHYRHNSREPDLVVRDINDQAAVEAVRSAHVDLALIYGTRLLTAETLDQLGVPIVNIHLGITPRYRGVHGGWWALYEGRRELVGTTIHYVDQGIDTGEVLAHVFSSPTQRDHFGTLPALQLVDCLPELSNVLTRVASGEALPVAINSAPSRLRYHPGLSTFLFHNARRTRRAAGVARGTPRRNR